MCGWVFATSLGASYKYVLVVRIVNVAMVINAKDAVEKMNEYDVILAKFNTTGEL